MINVNNIYHYKHTYHDKRVRHKFIRGALFLVFLTPLGIQAQSLQAQITWHTRAEFNLPLDGLVTEVPVSVGQQVSKGDLLVQVDSADAEAVLAAARAQFARANAANDEASQLREEQSELHELGASTSRALAQAEQDAKLAALDLEAGKRALTAAEHRVALTALKAPFDAWVIAVGVIEGQLLPLANHATPVIVLGSQTLQASFKVPLAQMQNFAQKFALGLPVEVKSSSGHAYAATITYLQPEPSDEAGELVFNAGAALTLPTGEHLLPGTRVMVELK